MIKTQKAAAGIVRLVNKVCEERYKQRSKIKTQQREREINIWLMHNIIE